MYIHKMPGNLNNVSHGFYILAEANLTVKDSVILQESVSSSETKDAYILHSIGVLTVMQC